MSEVIREPLGTGRWLDVPAQEHETACDGERFVLRTVQDGTWVEVAAAWCGSAVEDLRSIRFSPAQLANG